MIAFLCHLHAFNTSFGKKNSSCLIFELIKDFYGIYLLFANNTILSGFFLFFLIIDSYFLITALFDYYFLIFNRAAELIVPIGKLNNETRAEIETNLVIPESKASDCLCECTLKLRKVFCAFC